jgi:hypothetical protein
MGALEGAAAISDDDWQEETQQLKPALPGADQGPQTARAGSGYRACEGHYGTVFWNILAIGLAL